MTDQPHLGPPTPPHPCPGALLKLSPGPPLSPYLGYVEGLVVCNSNIPVFGYGPCCSGHWHMDGLPCLTSGPSYHDGPAWQLLQCVPKTAAGMDPVSLDASFILELNFQETVSSKELIVDFCLVSALLHHCEPACWSRLLVGPEPALFTLVGSSGSGSGLRGPCSAGCDTPTPWPLRTKEHLLYLGKRWFKDLNWQKHLHSKELLNHLSPGFFVSEKISSAGMTRQLPGKPLVRLLPNLDSYQVWLVWRGLVLWLV